ncbi:hypothetical protein Q3G72_007613 [Acer saccharum]|nr:hypothetical protein Q3G72_007613 [Acer saccharum]
MEMMMTTIRSSGIPQLEMVKLRVSLRGSKPDFIQIQSIPPPILFDSARVDRYLKVSLAYPPTLPTALPAALPVSSPSPSATSTDALPGPSREKDPGTVTAPSTDQPSSSQLRDKNLEEVVARFMKVCPRGSMQAETSMPWDIMASKGAPLLAEAFKFSVVIEKQVNVFREAAISARA